MSEQWLETLAKNRGPDLVKFTQRNILRIFPKTTRFDSSNYDPLVGWIHGAQMVAFNMQVRCLDVQWRGKISIYIVIILGVCVNAESWEVLVDDARNV